MKPILDYISIFAASIANIISGFSLIAIGRAHARMFFETDSELPLISNASIAYTSTFAPILVGLIVGVATLAGLVFVRRSDRFRSLLPFLLTISFIFVILHIMFVAFGAALPLFRITYSMSE